MGCRAGITVNTSVVEFPWKERETVSGAGLNLWIDSIGEKTGRIWAKVVDSSDEWRRLGVSAGYEIRFKQRENTNVWVPAHHFPSLALVVGRDGAKTIDCSQSVETHDVSKFPVGKKIRGAGLSMRITGYDLKSAYVFGVITMADKEWCEEGVRRGHPMKFRPSKVGICVGLREGVPNEWVAAPGLAAPENSAPRLYLSIAQNGEILMDEQRFSNSCNLLAGTGFRRPEFFEAWVKEFEASKLRTVKDPVE